LKRKVIRDDRTVKQVLKKWKHRNQNRKIWKSAEEEVSSKYGDKTEREVKNVSEASVADVYENTYSQLRLTKR